MATEQPYRIDNCSPEFTLGGRSIYTGDFIKLKGTEESKSSTVFIGKPSTVKGEVVVVESVTLSKKNTDSLKTVLTEINKIAAAIKTSGKDMTDVQEDAILEAVNASNFSNFLSTLKAPKGVAQAESYLTVVGELSSFIAENHLVKGRDGQKMAKGSIKRAMAALLGVDTTATLGDMQKAVMALCTQELLGEVLALPTDKKGYRKLKSTIVEQKVVRTSTKLNPRRLATLSGK